jgi:hypothetical protein
MTTWLSCSPSAQPHQQKHHVSPQLLSTACHGSESPLGSLQTQSTPWTFAKAGTILIPDTTRTRSKRRKRTDFQNPRRTAFPKPSHCSFPLPTNVDPVKIRAPLWQHISFSRTTVAGKSDTCHQLYCAIINASARPRTPESPVNFGSPGTPPAAVWKVICFFLCGGQL